MTHSPSYPPIPTLGGSDHGSLTGTVRKVLLTAPTSGIRAVRDLRILSRSAGNGDLTVSKTIGGVTHFAFHFVNAMGNNVLVRPVSADDVIHLKPDETITAILTASPATNPDYIVSWEDRK